MALRFIFRQNGSLSSFTKDSFNTKLMVEELFLEVLFQRSSFMVEVCMILFFPEIALINLTWNMLKFLREERFGI